MKTIKPCEDDVTGRLENLLACVAILPLCAHRKKPKRRDAGKFLTPLGRRFAESSRLKKLGIAWTEECEDAMSYGLWLRSRAGYLCAYCREFIPRPRRAVDHLVPLARGGAHRAENLVPSCQSCNLRKSDSLTFAAPLVPEFMAVSAWRESVNRP